MKALLKITLLSLCVLVTLSSCAFINSLVNEATSEAEKVADFTNDFVVLMEDPSVEKAEELIHPDSPLTPENVMEKIESNEKIQNLDFSQEIQIGEISDLRVSYHDEALGGNVYEADCQVTVGDVVINLTLKLLSTDDGFGIYDFDIK